MEDKELTILIKKEIKNPIARDKSINTNFEVIAQLFFDFMRLPVENSHYELEGCNRTMNAIEKLLGEKIEREDRNTFLADFIKVEPFLRKVLLFHDEDKYKKIETNLKGFQALISSLHLNPNNVDFKDSSRMHESCPYFIDHFINVYNIRNFEGHKLKEYSTRETGEFIESSLMIYIYVCNKFKVSLRKAINSSVLVPIPIFNNYCDNIIVNFKNRVGKIVHLNSTENITLSSTYVSEALISQDEDREIPIRDGTIDELRKTKVQENRMILWGDAGMGKTTTLEYLAYKDALEYKQNNEHKIPVFVPLGFLTDSNISLKQYIFNKLNVVESVGETMLDKGKLNLFLDGINEIPSDEKNLLRNLRYKEISRLIETTSKSFIIISNRPGDGNMFGSAPVFMIQKMNDIQIDDFINKYTSNQSNISNLLKEKLSIDERLKDIVRTPLMLSRLIEILKSDGIIPDNEPKIIDRFLKSLYKRERIEKQDANFNEDSIHRLLSYLACFCIEEKGTNSGLTKNEVYIQFQKCANDFTLKIDLTYVFEIVVQLNIVEIQEGLFSFSHQSYLDYYYQEYERSIFG